MIQKMTFLFNFKKSVRFPIFSLLFLFILLIPFTGCTPNDASANKPSTQNATTILDEINDTNAVALPEQIQLDTYYFGKIGNKDIILKFNKIEKKQFKGIIYDVTSAEVAPAVSFIGKAKKNKCILTYNGKKIIWNNFSISADQQSFKGYF